MNKDEFERLMEDIDKDLRAEDIPIDIRPIRTVMIISKQLKSEIVLAPEPSPPIPGQYNKSTLAAHINQWYDIRYGNRLKVHMGPGSVILLIKDEPWKMTFPRIFGTISLTCHPDLEKYRTTVQVSSGNQKAVCNVLNCIEELPAGLAGVLTEKERQEILAFFMNSYNILQRLEGITSKPYIDEARADLQSAADYILGKPPQYGLSKWSSLQFAEKLLKSYIELKKAPVPRHHNLKDIAGEAQKAGLVLSHPALLSTIQCKAGVRYGEEKVTLEEAISAHHASLELAKQLSDQIKDA